MPLELKNKDVKSQVFNDVVAEVKATMENNKEIFKNTEVLPIFFDHSDKLKKYLGKIEKSVPGSNICNEFRNVMNAAISISMDVEEEFEQTDKECIEDILNLDVVREHLDEFNKKTDFKYIGDPEMEVVYENLRLVQKFKNELDKLAVKEKSQEIQEENNAMLNDFPNIQNSIDEQFNKLTATAKNADIIYGEIPRNGVISQQQYLDSVNRCEVLINNHKHILQNDETERRKNYSGSADHEAEIKAFESLRNIAKLQYAQQEYVENDKRYIHFENMLENYFMQKRAYTEAANNPKIIFSEQKDRKRYEQLEEAKTELDNIFADENEIDDMANARVYARIRDNADIVFPGLDKSQINEKLGKIKEIYEDDIDELKNTISEAQKRFINERGTHSEAEKNKIKEVDKNILIFKGKLEQIKNDPEKYISQPENYKKLEDRKNREINKLLKNIKNTPIEKEITNKISEIKKTTFSEESFDKLTTEINVSINDRQLALIGKNTEADENRLNVTKNKINEFKSVEKITKDKLSEIRNKYENQIEKSNDFLNKNPDIAEIQRKAKKMYDEIEIVKRAGHKNSAEFEAMKSTLKNFAEMPNNENYLEMMQAAKNYKTEKKNGLFFKPFTTSFRGQRLKAASDILDLGEQFKSVTEAIENEKQSINNSVDKLSGLHYNQKVENKKMNDADILDIVKNQQKNIKNLDDGAMRIKEHIDIYENSKKRAELVSRVAKRKSEVNIQKNTVKNNELNI